MIRLGGLTGIWEITVSFIAALVIIAVGFCIYVLVSLWLFGRER